MSRIVQWTQFVSAIALLSCMAASQTRDDNWAECNSNDENFDHAIASCTALIQSGQETRPNLGIIFNNRGLTYRLRADAGDYDRAIRDFDQAIKLRPERSDFFQNRGDAYYLKREYKHAIQDYGHAIQLDSSNVQALHMRGLAHLDEHSYDEAIHDFSLLINRDPGYTGAFHNRGLAYECKGDFDHAIQDFDQALRDDPRSAYTFLSRGLVYHREREYSRAIQDYDRAIELLRILAGAWYNRALAKSAKGDKAGSEADLTRARQIDPTICRPPIELNSVCAPEGKRPNP